MTFEITLDMNALGEGDTILVKDEFGEYPDCAYVPKSMHDQLKAENAKLRELADAVKEFVEDTHCEDCPCRRDCDDNNRIFCANNFSYHAFAAMRELGIGVDE